MCKECFGKGVVSAVAAGIFGLLFFSAFWSQQAAFLLNNDWNNTLFVFAKYVVAFFFLGLAKMKGMEAKEAHEAFTKRRRR